MMNPETINTLLQVIISSTIAVVLIAVLRKPLRYVVGARAAYWIWLFVPASALVILVPVHPQSFHESAPFLLPPVRSAVSSALHAMNRASVSTNWVTGALAVWAFGMLVAVGVLSRRHLAFVKSLGAMTLQPDGSLRATGCVEPLLLGTLQPRVVLPVDFESRYEENERAMILAHELAHLRRRDAQVNALATVWLCISWFNPLMYWAVALFRFDQELACDATVLGQAGATPRRYADALLKVQLTADIATRQSAMGCYWHSVHPLKERISMLKRPLPRGLRRNLGFALTLAVCAVGCYAVKAAQADLPIPEPHGPLIALNVRWLFNDKEVPIMVGRVPHDNLLPSGGKLHLGFKSPEYGSNDFECSVKSGSATNPPTQPDDSGTFLIGCKLFNEGQVFATPSVLALDGETAVIKSTSPTGSMITLELNASSSEARVTAARRAMEAAAKMPPAAGEKRFFLLKPSSQQPPTGTEQAPH